MYQFALNYNPNHYYLYSTMHNSYQNAYMYNPCNKDSQAEAPLSPLAGTGANLSSLNLNVLGGKPRTYFSVHLFNQGECLPPRDSDESSRAFSCKVSTEKSMK